VEECGIVTGSPREACSGDPGFSQPETGKMGVRSRRCASGMGSHEEPDPEAAGGEPPRSIQCRRRVPDEASDLCSVGLCNVDDCMLASAEDVAPQSGCCAEAAYWLLVGVAGPESPALLTAERLPAAVVNELRLNGGTCDDESFKYGG